VALFFAVFAVLSAMGGLLQINPVWLYGPFRVQQVPSPAQPDWWMGWVEGALRIFPAWEVRAFGFEIPNPFFPGVLLPGITFMMLYAWPFLEARFTGDHDVHHLLDLPRDRPLRGAFGAACIAFYAVLQIAGSNDLIAQWAGVSVLSVTAFLQVAVVVVPIVAGWLTFRFLTRLKASGVERWTEMPWRRA
jgi:ubiquinol-cytochrome c reductase cytochrome b subunit